MLLSRAIRQSWNLNKKQGGDGNEISNEVYQQNSINFYRENQKATDERCDDLRCGLVKLHHSARPSQMSFGDQQRDRSSERR